MKLHSNQSGIAHVAAMLMVVFVAVAGIAGWRVYTVSQENKKLKQTTDNQVHTVNKSVEKPTQTPPKPTIPEGFIEYENKELGFKFAYPQEWRLKESRTTADQPANYKNLPSIVLTSNDFQEDEEAIAYGGTKTGARFSISVSSTDKKTLDELKNPEFATFYKNIKNVTVDGQPAQDYFFGYEGPPSQVLRFIHNGFEISFSYRYKTDQNSVYDQKYLKIRQQINDTIKFL